MNYQDIIFNNISGRREKSVKEKPKIKAKKEDVNFDDFLKSFDEFVNKKKSKKGGDYEIADMTLVVDEDTVVIPKPKKYGSGPESLESVPVSLEPVDFDIEFVETNNTTSALPSDAFESFEVLDSSPKTKGKKTKKAYSNLRDILNSLKK